MIPTPSTRGHLRRRFLVSAPVSCAALLLLSLATGQAAPAVSVPKNLGNGLGKLVESNLRMQAAQAKGRVPAKAVAVNGRMYADEQAAKYAAATIADAQDRILVRVNATGEMRFKAFRRFLKQNIGSLGITAGDKNYQGTGVLDAFVSIDDVPALAAMPGVRSVILEIKPQTRGISRDAALTAGGVNAIVGDVLNKLGTAFDQGVTQHRVDQINKFYNPNATLDYEGTGMTIACMSDSFAKFTTTGRTAAAGVASFDLPGDPSNPINTQPVVVLEDYVASSTDEGRAMCEIVYKMAPKARVGFATAFLGTVDFANNIRALAGLPGYTYPAAVQQGFAADVICDDVSYEDEPFFQDGIIGRGVNDVAAAGVSYFSSAGNELPINAYASDFRPVPYTGGTTAADSPALVGTNINLAGVPANLYAGGFHNFNPTAGQQDVAQLVNIPNGNTSPVAFEWDDPYDQPLPTSLNIDPTPIYSNTGTIATTSASVTFNDLPTLVAGQEYVFKQVTTSGTLDGQISVIDASGNLVAFQDTSTDETLQFFTPATGQYSVKITQLGNTGSFTLNVYTAHDAPAGVSTDFNLLVFDANGNYLPNNTLATNNIATNEAVEYGVITRATGQTQVQFVMARANIPSVPNPASHLRYVFAGNGAGGLGPAEYFSYVTPTTGGHNAAAGANGAAAYSVFRPSLPESFTSGGPVTIYFDPSGNRLATPEVRLQPAVAAADAANESFFSSDSGNDPDTISRNFSGTSAAAPHATAIAALVLEAHGGPRSVTPAQMTSILQRSAFPHDLDPVLCQRHGPRDERREGDDHAQQRFGHERRHGRQQRQCLHGGLLRAGFAHEPDLQSRRHGSDGGQRDRWQQRRDLQHHDDRRHGDVLRELVPGHGVQHEQLRGRQRLHDPDCERHGDAWPRGPGTFDHPELHAEPRVFRHDVYQRQHFALQRGPGHPALGEHQRHRALPGHDLDELHRRSARRRRLAAQRHGQQQRHDLQRHDLRWRHVLGPVEEQHWQRLLGAGRLRLHQRPGGGEHAGAVSPRKAKDTSRKCVGRPTVVSAFFVGRDGSPSRSEIVWLCLMGAVGREQKIVRRLADWRIDD